MASEDTKKSSEKKTSNPLGKIIRVVIIFVLCIPVISMLIKVNKVEKENEMLWDEVAKIYFEKGLDQEINKTVPIEKQESTPVKEENTTVNKGNNLNRKFRQNEMEKYFPVELIHSNEPENYFMKRLMKDYDINSDEKMKQYPEEYKVNSIMYKKYIEENGQKDDIRFYIQLIDQYKGFGLFANEQIKQNDVIGVYTGLITMLNGKKIYNPDYLFYITHIKHPYTGAKADIYIDSRAAGNQLRFVNHDANANCEAIYVPYNGMWNIVFVAKRNIEKDEEITLNYGKDYHSVRGKDIVVKEEESGPDDYLDTEWDKKRKEEKDARDPITGKKLNPNIPNRYELEAQKRKILQRMKNSRGY